MRRLSANYIYPVSGKPLKNGIIEINDKGKILNIIDTKGNLEETRNLEFYNGVIVPGFINTHCHLELSELKDKFSKKAGLPAFIQNIVKHKGKDKTQQTIEAIELYDDLMQKMGIIAVGDISNYDYTLQIKKNSKIHYHTFIEAIGSGDNAKQIFEINKNLYQKYKNTGLSASIVPHAPYSVSKKLFILLKQFAEKYNLVYSIHNQETSSENQMFYNKTGSLFNTLETLNINLSSWETTGLTSLQSIMPFLPQNNNVILVHNVYTTDKDIVKIQENITSNLFWCLCPLSNLFIENKLPDITLINSYSDNIILGTDGLASNETLSILDEMKTISHNFKNISFDNIIQWATLNGAKALNIQEKYGSLEKGKTPGINLITNFNFNAMQLTDKSNVKVLSN